MSRLLTARQPDETLAKAPAEAFALVRRRTGELGAYPKRLLWGVLGEVDLAETPWAKFDEVWS